MTFAITITTVAIMIMALAFTNTILTNSDLTHFVILLRPAAAAERVVGAPIVLAKASASTIKCSLNEVLVCSVTDLATLENTQTNKLQVFKSDHTPL